MISVIIPVYNRKEYLDKCILSVLSQENVDVEIVLVDDGSTDGSEYVVDEYTSKYTNVVSIHQPNKGLSAARNAGLNICKGEYIFFLDSDDYIAAGSLFKLLKKIQETDTDIVIGKYSRYFEDGTLEYDNILPERLKNKVLEKNELLSLMYIENSYLWCVSWGKLYKRKVFDNIRFPDGKFSEDEFIMPQILDAIDFVYMMDEEIYHQTLSRGSIVRSDVTLKKLDATEAILVMLEYLLNHSLYELALFRFGVGTRHLMKWQRETTDTDVLNGIRIQYDRYKVIARRLIPYVNFRNKMRLLLFCFNFDLYIITKNIIDNWKK